MKRKELAASALYFAALGKPSLNTLPFIMKFYQYIMDSPAAKVGTKGAWKTWKKGSNAEEDDGPEEDTLSGMFHRALAWYNEQAALPEGRKTRVVRRPCPAL